MGSCQWELEVPGFLGVVFGGSEAPESCASVERIDDPLMLRRPRAAGGDQDQATDLPRCDPRPQLGGMGICGWSRDGGCRGLPVRSELADDSVVHVQNRVLQTELTRFAITKGLWEARG